MEAWKDSRIATELCRLESQAAELGVTMSLDKVTAIQPRRQRLSDRNAAEGRRGGKSNYAALRDTAKNHQRRARAGGFESIAARLEGDPFYQHNCAMAQ